MPTGKGPFRIAIEDFLESFDFGRIIGIWYKTFVEGLEKDAMKVYDEILHTLYTDDNIPPQIETSKVSKIVLSSQNGFIAWILFTVGMIIGGFTGISQPSARIAAFSFDKRLRSQRPSPESLAVMARRLGKDAINFDETMKLWGLLPEHITATEELTHQYLTAFEYITAYRRNEISLEQALDNMYKSGLSKEDAEVLVKITEVIPTVTDLIYLAVKEGFDDQLSARFQHDENYPTEVDEWAKKQGLPSEWTKRYWRAHWQLPGPQQVFEMFQRLRPGISNVPVTEDDVSLYLRMADYSPFWRDRLREIAFIPITRVDIRRMYKVGTFNEADVKKAYLDIGYDEANAQKLTEFTIAYEAEEETGVVRQSVVSAYSDGMIDRSKAQSMLKQGGYDDISIAFYLDAVDFDQQQTTNKIILQAIKLKYINGDLDETSVNNEINKLNLPSERVLALLEQWTIERDNQIQQPTQTQVEKFVELGIATIEDYQRISRLRGYTEESIQWNIKRIQIEQQAQAAKDAADAAKEMERVLKDKDNSQYQVDKADIELAIAQAKEQITDIDIALQTETNPDTITALGQNKNDLKLFIAQMNTAKAQLKYDFQSDKERLVTPNE